MRESGAVTSITVTGNQRGSSSSGWRVCVIEPPTAVDQHHVAVIESARELFGQAQGSDR